MGTAASVGEFSSYRFGFACSKVYGCIAWSTIAVEISSQRRHINHLPRKNLTKESFKKNAHFENLKVVLWFYWSDKVNKVYNIWNIVNDGAIQKKKTIWFISYNRRKEDAQ